MSAEPLPVPSRPRSARWVITFWVCAIIAVSAALAVYAVRKRLHEAPTVCEESPVAERKVFSITPTDASAAVPVGQIVRAEVVDETIKIDPSTVNEGVVGLLRVSDHAKVDGQVNVSADGKIVEMKPAKPLAPSTNYTFIISSGLKDTTGRPVPTAQIAFATAAEHADKLAGFDPIPLPATDGLGITCVQFGPDGRLYGAVDDGRIVRFDVAADGTLSNKLEIDSLVRAGANQPRLIGGLAFDPAQPADKPVVWVTHTSFGFKNMGDWRGSVSRLSGPDLSICTPIVVDLPRSARDHILHQPVFGPDGCLYFQSGSMSSFGEPDGYWGWRREHAFSACVVKIDIKKLPGQLPIDVKTPEDGGTYDRNDPDAAVTVYASGMRVTFDLLWHSSGKLFAAVNGSSAGGNTPAGPNAPLIWTVVDTEPDWLFDVKPGGYYGHPNPAQGHYVLNGGNPTPGPDFGEVTQYPVGTQPDPKWQPAVFEFGNHVSPNGMIEYRGDGPLGRTIVVCRYVLGDLLAIKIDKDGNVAGTVTDVPGWGDLQSPLDLCQDPKSGNLYVSEYGKHAVTLLRAKK